MKTAKTDQRRADLAAIHIDAKKLGLINDQDDSAYRDMLWTMARVRSAGDLDAGGRKRVRDHLRALLGPEHRTDGRRRHHPGAPHNIDSQDCGPMLRKIEAYLAEAKRPWAYADGMAQKMFHVERLAFCRPEQLHSMIAALEKDAQRHGRHTGD